MHPRPSGIVTLLTDFGLADPYVGVMKGVILRGHQKATIVDLGHQVAAHDVAAGAFALAAAIGHFPNGTVHVAVIDPGVGGDRRLLAACAHDCYWLAPDNGLLAPVLDAAPTAELRALDLEHLGLPLASRTFHGRDGFAPVAGGLAGGRYGFRALGRRIDDPVALPVGAAGPHVVYQDGFGNLVTSVHRDELAGVRAVRIGGVEIMLRGTYGEAAAGELLALVGSFQRLEIAENRGSAARTLGSGPGAAIELLR